MLRTNLENGVITVVDAPMPERPAGYALLRLIVAGICNTDLELQRGYYGFSGTPGHEFVAEVVETDDRALVGKRVVGEINLACGRCEWCRKGLGRHCPTRTVLGIVRHPGAFAEFFTLPEANLHVVPEGVALDRAVFTEPLAAACEILDQVAIPAGGPVAVLGDGKWWRNVNPERCVDVENVVKGLPVVGVDGLDRLAVEHAAQRAADRAGVLVLEHRAPEKDQLAAVDDHVVDAGGPVDVDGLVDDDGVVDDHAGE